MKKRILGLLLIVCMITVTISTPVHAADSFNSTVSDTFTKQGSFSYSASNGKDATSNYVYEDCYFYNSSYTYNPHLSTMSLCLALSAFASNSETSYKNKIKNVSDLLSDLKFKDFKVNAEALSKPTADSIAVAVANKTLYANGKPYTLIAVAVRGGGYGAEWASNFTVGKTGQHAGFEQAKNKVLHFLTSYITSEEIHGDLKLWITGYSRGAAVSNLLAGNLDDTPDCLPNCTLSKEDMYTYTFECPAGSTYKDSNRNEKYFNIFNIINGSDLVTKVAPSYFDFVRYGVDINLPTSATDDLYETKKEAMLQKYNALRNVPSYVVDDFQMMKLSIKFFVPKIENDTKNSMTQEQFLNHFFDKMSSQVFRSRQNYVEHYEEFIRNCLVLYYTIPSSKQENFVNSLKNSFVNDLKHLNLTSLSYKQLSKKINSYVETAVKQLNLDCFTPSMLTKFTKILTDFVIDFGITNIDSMITLLSNINSIKQAHHQEICLAWLQSQDSYY